MSNAESSKSSLSRRAVLASAGVGLAAAPMAALAQDFPRTILFEEIRRRAPVTGLAPDVADLSHPAVADERYWSKVRSQFNLIDGLTFLNTGTLGVMPKVALDTQQRWAVELATDPRSSVRLNEQEQVRLQIADYAGASADTIALTRSTTEGMNLFAQGLDWRRGDEVILDRREHFLIFESYETLAERHGIKLVWIDLPLTPNSTEELLTAYRKAITPRTRLIVASHVNYGTGLRLPIAALAELAHSRSVLISVDGAQGAGAVPLDLAASGVDHYAAPGHKWVLGGAGTGFAFLRQELQDRVWPLAGYHDRRVDAESMRSARRYERNGQRHVPSVMGLGAALTLHDAICLENVHARIGELAGATHRIIGGLPGASVLTPADPTLHAGITVVRFAGQSAVELVPRILDKHGILIRPTDFAGIDAVRISTHIYNSVDEIERLAAALRTETKA